MTVCQIKRNNAEGRIVTMLEGRAPKPAITGQPENGDDESESARAPVDIAQHGKDLIRERISQRFKGHKLGGLIEQLLIAQGYSTERTAEGADGGVDIVAGPGSMGFERPRLAVQVKSTASPEGEGPVCELQGV